MHPTRFYPTDHSALKRQLAFANQYKSIINDAAKFVRCKPSLIAAIGSHESGWGMLLTPPGPKGVGDNGHGRGLMQIDDRWHKEFIASGLWRDPRANIEYGAGLLKEASRYFRKNGITDEDTWLRYAIAAYNAGCSGVKRVVEEGKHPDTATTGGNYSRDVFNRADWFQRQGWV